MKIHGPRAGPQRASPGKHKAWLVGILALFVAVAMTGLGSHAARADFSASGSATFEVLSDIGIELRGDDLYFGRVVPSASDTDILWKTPSDGKSFITSGSPLWITQGDFAIYDVTGNPNNTVEITVATNAGCTDSRLVFLAGIAVDPGISGLPAVVTVGGKLEIRNTAERVPAGYYTCAYTITADYIQ